jgi:hypothetical protein
MENINQVALFLTMNPTDPLASWMDPERMTYLQRLYLDIGERPTTNHWANHTNLSKQTK